MKGAERCERCGESRRTSSAFAEISPPVRRAPAGKRKREATWRYQCCETEFSNNRCGTPLLPHIHRVICGRLVVICCNEMANRAPLATGDELCIMVRFPRICLAPTFTNSPTSATACTNASVSPHRFTYALTLGNVDSASLSPSESTTALALTPTTTSARDGVTFYRRRKTDTRRVKKIKGRGVARIRRVK